jgi:hypothetical protein
MWGIYYHDLSISNIWPDKRGGLPCGGYITMISVYPISGLIRGVAFGESGLIRRGLLYMMTRAVTLVFRKDNS